MSPYPPWRVVFVVVVVVVHRWPFPAHEVLAANEISSTKIECANEHHQRAHTITHTTIFVATRAFYFRLEII